MPQQAHPRLLGQLLELPHRCTIDDRFAHLVVEDEQFPNRLTPPVPRAATMFAALAAARIGPSGWDRVYSVRIGVDWTRELKRLQTFGRLASVSPEEGQVFVDAPQAWREVAGTAAQDLQWLEEEAGELTTLQRLGRARRLAA